MNNIIGFALWNDAVRADENLPHFENWEEEEDCEENDEDDEEDMN